MVDVFEFEADTPLPKGMPPQFLVAGVVHRSVTVFYGQQDTGKSMLALSVAVAVAGGQPWLGRPVENSGPVAIVSGDPDGKYEYAERLDKVRDDLRPGKVKVITPAIPAEAEAWEEIRAEASGCSLVILDNLHQFVPGSLKDDDGVKLVYQEIDKLRRKTGAAVLVITHLSDHRGEHGYSQVPYGTSAIRFGPRWFGHLWRAGGKLEVQFSGNGGKRWHLSLSEPTDAPRFTELGSLTADELAERRAARARNRDKATLDANAKDARLVIEHCQEMTKAEAARWLEANGSSGKKASTYQKDLSRGPLAAMLSYRDRKWDLA